MLQDRLKKDRICLRTFISMSSSLNRKPMTSAMDLDGLAKLLHCKGFSSLLDSLGRVEGGEAKWVVLPANEAKPVFYEGMTREAVVAAFEKDFPKVPIAFVLNAVHYGLLNER